MEVRLLGRFVVRHGEAEIPARDFGGRRVRTLIRLLASRPGELVPRDILADALWPERLPADPAANLEVLVHRARRALGDPALIATGDGAYALVRSERCVIDAEEFRALTEIGRSALRQQDWARSLGSFTQALGWWRGEPLVEDTYADWAVPVRASLHRLQLQALEGAAEAALRLGDPLRAVEFAEMAVAREPLREAARMLLMRSLYLSGDRAAALRTFEELRRDLAEELGVDPSPEVMQLHAEILRGDLGVDESLRRVIAGSTLDEDLKDALGGARGAALRSLALSRMAAYAAGADDYRRASRLAELAVAEASDDPPARAEALAAMAVIDMNLGRLEEGERRADEAFAIFDRLSDHHGRARILDLRAMLTFLAGHIRAGVAAFGDVADLFEESGDLVRSITPRSTRGHGLVHMERARDGLAEIDRALEIAQDLRHREMTGYCLWHRSEALAALGSGEEALADAEASLRIARELGHREWTAAALRAVGIARTVLEGAQAAEAAFREALAAAEGLPLCESWAAARLALALVARGKLDEAERMAEVALAGPVPHSLFEARLAQAEVLAARGAVEAVAVIRRSLTLAIEEGHLTSARRLAELLGAVQ